MDIGGKPRFPPEENNTVAIQTHLSLANIIQNIFSKHKWLIWFSSFPHAAYKK